jgi:hypothetical protein
MIYRCCVERHGKTNILVFRVDTVFREERHSMCPPKCWHSPIGLLIQSTTLMFCVVKTSNLSSAIMYDDKVKKIMKRRWRARNPARIWITDFMNTALEHYWPTGSHVLNDSIVFKHPVALIHISFIHNIIPSILQLFLSLLLFTKYMWCEKVDILYSGTVLA